MTTATQSAIDVVTAALEADGAFVIGVEVSDTPVREFSLQQLGSDCILHVEGGGTGFDIIDRSVTLGRQIDVAVTAIYRVGSDAATGYVDMTKFGQAEAAVEKIVELVRDAVVGGSSRFALSAVEQPERYLFEMLKDKRVFMSSLIFTLEDTTPV